MSQEYEKLLAKNGYLRCKVDVSDILMQKHREINDRLSVLRKEIETMEICLERQKKTNEYLLLLGESNSLFWVNRALSSCVPGTAS